MSYDPPDWTTTTPVNNTNLQKETDAIEYMHIRHAYTFDENGDMVYDADGVGDVEYKLTVDPASYSGYDNQDYKGEFTVTLPTGLLSTLEGLQVTMASGSNREATVTVRNETAASFDCTVADVNKATLSAFALWIHAKGKLNSGKIP